MAASKNKTESTKASVAKFVDAVEDDAQRADAAALVLLFTKISGYPPRMWGTSIVGFGAYAYTYESGRSGTACAVGFSPRKGKLAIYWGRSGPTTDALLRALGKHEPGGGCLYIKRLSDIDVRVLQKLVKSGLANRKKEWPVTPT